MQLHRDASIADTVSPTMVNMKLDTEVDEEINDHGVTVTEYRFTHWKEPTASQHTAISMLSCIYGYEIKKLDYNNKTKYVTIAWLGNVDDDHLLTMVSVIKDLFK